MGAGGDGGAGGVGGEEDGEGVRTVTGGVFARGEVQGASRRHRKGNGVLWTGRGGRT